MSKTSPLRYVLFSIAAGLAIAAGVAWGFKWYYFYSPSRTITAEEAAFVNDQIKQNEEAYARLTKREQGQRIDAKQFHQERERAQKQMRRQQLLDAFPPALPLDAAKSKAAQDEAVAYAERLEGLYKAEDFDGLEAVAAEARSSTWTSASGEPRIVLFYRFPLPTQSKRTSYDFLLERCQRWREKKPDSITPLVAAMYVLDHRAWSARGSGFAFTVSPQGAAVFRESLEQAAKLAEQARELQPSEPALYAKLIDIGKGLGWQENRVYGDFAAGRKLDPDFAPLYVAMSEYLLPRWHGDPGDLENFAESCRDDAGAGTGDQRYARIALHVSRYERDRLFANTTLEFDSIYAGWKAMPAELRDSVYMVNRMAWLSAVAKNEASAKELLEPLKDNYAHGAWEMIGLESFLDLADPRQTHPLWEQLNPKNQFGLFDVAFSPDGSQIATAGFPGSGANVRLGLVSALTSLNPMTGLPRGARTVAFSPDGKWLAGAGDSNRVFLWPTDGKQATRELTAPNGRLEQLAFSSDGRSLLAVCPAHGVYLWDLEAGGDPTLVDVNGEPSLCAEFVPQSKQVSLLGWNGVVQRLDLESGEIQEVANVGELYPRMLLIDGRPYPRPPALGPEALAKCLTAEDGDEWRANVLGAAAYDATNHRLAVAQREVALQGPFINPDAPAASRISIWDVATKAKIAEFPAGEQTAFLLEFSSDGTRLAWVSGSEKIDVRDFQRNPLPVNTRPATTGDDPPDEKRRAPTAPKAREI